MKRAFTLTEMIVSIVVIAALVIPNVADMRKDATAKHIESNIRILQTAVDRFALANDGKLPTVTPPPQGSDEAEMD